MTIFTVTELTCPLCFCMLVSVETKWDEVFGGKLQKMMKSNKGKFTVCEYDHSPGYRWLTVVQSKNNLNFSHAVCITSAISTCHV